jgi:hypothetical protein
LVAVAVVVMNCQVVQLIHWVEQVALVVEALIKQVLEALQLPAKEMQVVLVAIVLGLLVAVAVRVRLVAVPVALLERLAVQVLPHLLLALLLPMLAVAVEVLTAIVVVLEVLEVEALAVLLLVLPQLMVQVIREEAEAAQEILLLHCLATAALVSSSSSGANHVGLG